LGVRGKPFAKQPIILETLRFDLELTAFEEALAQSLATFQRLVAPPPKDE
jgi:hypothetical protein